VDFRQYEKNVNAHIAEFENNYMVWSNYKSLTSLEQVNILTSLFLTHHSCHFQTFKKSKLGQKTGSGRTIRVHQLQLGPSLQTLCLQNLGLLSFTLQLQVET